uniref:HMG box domain-containing protein n=1 Tax=Lotharella globosa TaxID=91324 RepID=A0A7S3ZCE5_9EUKA
MKSDDKYLRTLHIGFPGLNLRYSYQHNEKVARIIGKRWKALNATERKVFQSMADRDKIRCQQENENYIKRMCNPAEDNTVEKAAHQSDVKKSTKRKSTKPVISEDVDEEYAPRRSHAMSLSRKKKRRTRYIQRLDDDQDELQSDVSTEDKSDYSEVDAESTPSDESDDDELAAYDFPIIHDPNDIARHYNAEEWGQAAQKFAGALVRVWRIRNPWEC